METPHTDDAAVSATDALKPLVSQSFGAAAVQFNPADTASESLGNSGKPRRVLDSVAQCIASGEVQPYTDPSVIEMVRADVVGTPPGAIRDGVAWCYPEQIERWRKAQERKP